MSIIDLVKKKLKPKQKSIEYSSEDRKKIRATENKCYICGEQFHGLIEDYFCHYCRHYFCLKHHLPENHNCNGNPKTPSGGMVETQYADGSITVRGK